MGETQTSRKLRVSTAQNAGPYIKVPLSESQQLSDLLTSHGIDHWVESGSISIDGRPYMTVVNLGRKADVNRIQAILDRAS